MPRPLTVKHRTALLRDAIELMEDDYGASLTVDAVARRIATSRRQLQRCFDEHADTTFRTCLAAILMRRAAELLAETSLSVKQVANRVGYHQPAQFAKVFRRHHGVTPSRYRCMQRADAITSSPPRQSAQATASDAPPAAA